MVVASRGEREAATKVGGRLGLNSKETREEKPRGWRLRERLWIGDSGEWSASTSRAVRVGVDVEDSSECRDCGCTV